MSRSRRVRHGYTVSDLELCLGESHHKIKEWINSGWLRPRLQGTHRHDGNGHDIHRVREKDILDFIRNHPQEINLGKVDQMWFPRPGAAKRSRSMNRESTAKNQLNAWEEKA